MVAKDCQKGREERKKEKQAKNLYTQLLLLLLLHFMILSKFMDVHVHALKYTETSTALLILYTYNCKSNKKCWFTNIPIIVFTSHLYSIYSSSKSFFCDFPAIRDSSLQTSFFSLDIDKRSLQTQRRRSGKEWNPRITFCIYPVNSCV